VQKAAVQRSRHISPGDKLGKYEVIRQIAVGGMAELYLARTLGIEGFEKLVVVKRILPQYVTSASFVEMFLNEARLAATLHHPNVAQVYDIGLEDGDYFFAMEYVHGEDLDHVAAASDEQGVPISMDAALTLVAGLCAGLHYAHDKASPEGKPLQIVHRDVSPSNVLVSYDGAVKLVDFGIARASSRPGTTQGGLKGKIAYMSPEQCQAKAQLDRRSDIYSVGTILYQLTTGRLPFVGETEYQVLSQIVKEDVPPPSKLVPSYPAALEQIVLRALARDPAARYATARDLQGAIEDFAHETRLRVSPLVLARLMGTLFPARLEEWDQAKKQGAFFVEQQVVRTLIESGRDPNQPPTSRGAVITDDEPTLHSNPPPTHPSLQSGGMQFLGDTTSNVAPISTEGSTLTGVAPLMLTPARPLPIIPETPKPQQPQMYPVYTPGSPGTLVSSSGVGPSLGVVQAQVAQQYEVTERVRVPPNRRLSTPTTFVRSGTGTVGWLAILGGVVIAGGVAAFIATRGGDDAPAPVGSSAATTPPAAEVTPTPPTPTPTPPTPPTPAAEALPSDEPDGAPEEERAPPTPPAPPETAEPPPPATAGAEPAQTQPQPVAKKPARATTKRSRAKAKSEAKTVDKKGESKPAWNADSPFMPVRTEKK
jgi:serine/threonine protein kinase